MGCDIHMHVEVKKDGRWVEHNWRKQHDTSRDEKSLSERNYDTYFKDYFYVGRNYNLFAILADVRNGTGFAGCDTGDPFFPIASPKGLPADVSSEVLQEYSLRIVPDAEYDEDVEGICTETNAKRWIEKGYSKQIDDAHVSGPDWHSASWFTVAELLSYDWNQVTAHRGWVDPWDFELFRKNGKPKNWCGSVSGGFIEHISNQQMARMIDEGEIQWEGPDDGNPFGRPYSTSLQRTLKASNLPDGSVGAQIRDRQSYYTLVEWKETYAESVKEFLEKTIPAIQKLGDPSNVRIVFWFDN